MPSDSSVPHRGGYTLKQSKICNKITKQQQKQKREKDKNMQLKC